jgi:beta-1,4-mannosyl-glycoprotein beta-1,4-N-acetylglucosaminyltransferase
MIKQKIVDSFLLFNELDLLEIRLEELYDHVDMFLIVESTKTFTGKLKPLNYKNNADRFKKWQDKISYFIVDDMPIIVDEEDINNSTKNDSQKTIEFYRERHHRNSIGRGLKNLNLSFEDIVIVSDIDEIPNPNSFKNLNHNLPYGPIVFKQKWLVWNTNLEKMHHWMGSTVFYYSHYINNNKIFQEIRDMRWDEDSTMFYTQENGGFHFSWFGDFDFIRQKLKAFSHTELVSDFWDSDDNISNLIGDMYASNGIKKDGITGKLKPFTQDNYDLPKLWHKIKSLEVGSNEPKIYDCFLFDHELDMLNLRLHEMNNYVDHFILIESRNSHTGKDKELFFQKHKDLFSKFSHKIEHIVIDLPNEVLYEPYPLGIDEEDNLNKFRENYNRNAIKDVLERISPDDNDIILISDVDEIWDNKILSKIKHNQINFNTFKTITQRWHYWNFKWDFSNMYWPGPAFCRWSYLKTTTPQKIRNVRYEEETHLNGINGWHLSWFGNVECNLHKLKNTHHQELNVHNKDSINNMIVNGYLFDGQKMITLDWDYYPKYRHLIEDGKLYKNIHE